MGKAIFWISIFIGALVVTRILARKAAQREASDNQNPPKSTQQAPINHAEKMLQCEHCGVHLPGSEAVTIEGHVWCSREHANQGVRQHS